MTTTTLSPLAVQRFLDNNNNPLVGGQLFTYAGGTTTPLATYTDNTGAIPNTNPIILNARGECNCWLTPNTAYKFVLEDSSNNVIWTVDQITSNQFITLYGGVDIGIVNAYVLNFTATFSSLTNGIVIYWIPANTNTGVSTLNVNGLGPASVVLPNGSALPAGAITAGQTVEVMYYNGSFQILTAFGNLVCAGLTATGNITLGSSGTTLTGYGATATGQVDMSPDYGSFTGTFTGVSGTITGTVWWYRIGKIVLMVLPAATGTSNSTSFGMTGIPAELQPGTHTINAFFALPGADNGGSFTTGVAVSIQSGGTLVFSLNGSNSGWTASGTKGFPGVVPQSFVYSLL